ncbi:hypothetical protein FZZ91_05795 [Synechococcus sp. HB1133]|nr:MULTISPECIES: hypothetical protein [unclassified Synechococcus]MCB4422350.1 hypothetical protein [Synechococcus sp. HB1133]MCB4429546.1 hypothetical protein [Synechococcus sp. HBA1120]
MTPKPPESSRTMQDDQDYREPWDQAGSTGATSREGPATKEFHFREAGVQRFNDIYDWDDDDH